MLNSALSIKSNNILSMRYLSLFLFFLVCNDLYSDEKIKVGGLNFKIPKDWVSQSPDSSMRTAQYSIKDPEKKKSGEVLFFYFGNNNAGGIKANVLRWLYQFKEDPQNLNPIIVQDKINDVNVTYVSAYGTYLKGLPLREKTPVDNCQLFGAIIEGDLGTVFIKATGDKNVILNNRNKFKEMIKSALNSFYKTLL